MATSLVFSRALLSVALLLFCASIEAYNYSLSGSDWPTLCVTGKKQSPIIINSKTRKNIGRTTFKIDYATYQGFTVRNTGHVIQVLAKAGTSSKFYTAKGNYTLAQFHFHSSAEHSINGELGPLECHFVHLNDADPTQIAVIAVLFRLNPAHQNNAFIEKFLGSVPYTGPTDQNSTNTLNPGSLFENGKVKYFYTYEGSLTAPPCTETVTFYVLTAIQYVSVNQLEKMLDVVAVTNNGERTNNRMPQPLNGRKVYFGQSS
eukprot:TRINITY_DN4283_c0_g1_i1.p1 TRINITY_DN4283_c0_g1~~TRINITY_DN4283_c0_g1_i1.p1  ORF type:complete len:298 (-),score=31.86 TRINITY_DN4283_c0_g1_i1:1748-2527(-)